MAHPDIDVRRVYADRSGHDGEYRVLVDRLWPRGVSKESLRIDLWAVDVAPSTELRRWYGHDPARFEEFARRYRAELRGKAASTALATVRAAARSHRVLVLLTATKDVERSGATVLARHLARSGRT